MYIIYSVGRPAAPYLLFSVFSPIIFQSLITAAFMMRYMTKAASSGSLFLIVGSIHYRGTTPMYQPVGICVLSVRSEEM